MSKDKKDAGHKPITGPIPEPDPRYARFKETTKDMPGGPQSPKAKRGELMHVGFGEGTAKDVPILDEKLDPNSPLQSPDGHTPETRIAANTARELKAGKPVSMKTHMFTQLTTATNAITQARRSVEEDDWSDAEMRLVKAAIAVETTLEQVFCERQDGAAAPRTRCLHRLRELREELGET